MSITPSNRNGFVMLLTVLVVGTMASAAAISILLLGIGIERNAFSIQQSTQAYYNAWTCAENAISALRKDLSYTGNHERSFVYGYANNQGGTSYGTTTCKIYPIGGSDNTDRTICTEGTFGNFTIRRLEVKLSRVLPSTLVDSWKEVETITECDPFTGPTPANCGNGLVESGLGEECDDGNENNNDGCSSICKDEVCGDDIQQAGEQCDDGNTDNGDGCDENCLSEICGDSVIATGEECDDGNTTNNDGCSSVCLNEVCGDDVLQTDEECDDGNTDNGDGCDENCEIETSSDPSPTDYVGYWKLDETSASVDVQDSSPNNEDGDPRGGASVSTSDLAPLLFSNTASRDLDGNNDYIRFSTSSHLFPSDITVSFWAKTDGNPSQWDGLVCKTNGTSWTKGWGFFFNSSSQVRFFIQNHSSNYSYASINPTQWNHILGTFNNSSNVLTVYVNGVAGTSDTYTSSSFNRTRRFTIGRCGNNAYNINGKIDDVRIYDRVLTTTEIAALASGN